MPVCSLSHTDYSQASSSVEALVDTAHLILIRWVRATTRQSFTNGARTSNQTTRQRNTFEKCDTALDKAAVDSRATSSVSFCTHPCQRTSQSQIQDCGQRHLGSPHTRPVSHVLLLNSWLA